MTVSRIAISFLILILISATGCFLANSPPLYRTNAMKYLSDHSHMTKPEIRDFVWDGTVDMGRLLELSRSKSSDVRVLVAENSLLPLPYLEKMTDDKSPEVVLACSRNPNITPALYDKLASHQSEFVRTYLPYNNKRIPIKNLVALSKDESMKVRAMAARNSRLPEEDIRRLAGEEFSNVKEGVARNPNVPLGVLVELSKEDDFLVIKAAAKNAKLPQEDIRRVYSMKTKASLHRGICKSLTKNPSTPLDILIEISKTSKDYISKAAMQHPKMKNYTKE